MVEIVTQISTLARRTGTGRHMNAPRIVKANLEHHSAWTDLISGYPFKQFQRAAQGIDRRKQVGFLAAGARRQLENEKTSGWIAYQGTRPVAAAHLEPNAWHSKFFARPMGRIDSFLNYWAPESAGPPLIQAIDREAREREFEHLSIRIDGADYENLRLLEDHGFRLIDVSLKLGAPIRNDMQPPTNGARVRPLKPGDRDGVLALAAGSHPHNHFYNDPAFSREAVDTLFRAWVERCIDGLAHRIFVVEVDDADEPVGFVTYLRNEALNRELSLNLVILDYIVIDAPRQGHGLGRILMEQSLAALSEEFDQVELRTSHHNEPAIAAYLKYGFRLLASDFQLHRRLDQDLLY